MTLDTQVRLMKTAELDNSQSLEEAKSRLRKAFAKLEDTIERRLDEAANSRSVNGLLDAASHEHRDQLVAENKHLRDENQNLQSRVGEVAERVDDLIDQLQSMIEVQAN